MFLTALFIACVLSATIGVLINEASKWLSIALFLFSIIASAILLVLWPDVGRAIRTDRFGNTGSWVCTIFVLVFSGYMLYEMLRAHLRQRKRS